MSSPNPIPAPTPQTQGKPLSRRDFVRVLSAAAAAGPGLIAAGLSGWTLTRSQRAEAAEAIVFEMGKLPQRSLGTRMGGMKVTPICICSDWNGDLIAPGVAAGINFIHKAGYWNTVPEAVQKLPRESYYTDITVDSTPNHPDDFDRAYNQVASSLEHNGLKYYDIFRAHFGWRSVDAFKNQTGTYKAFQRLKREGKVKYFGVSQHTSSGDFGDGSYPTDPEIIQAEIDSGLIDSIQAWFSYGYPKDVEEVFARASKAGIGMTAMKVCAHGMPKLQQNPAVMAEQHAPGKPGRALIRHVLSVKRPDGRPIFHTCVSALHNLDQFEENVGAVSPRVSMLDGFTLAAV
jgi:predicted aldo/keto reductase-like oxidoreductase